MSHDSDSKPSGCLGIFFKIFGVGRSASNQARDVESSSLPYQRRDPFLSPAELAFYRVLQQAVGDRYVTNNKVRMWDVLTVPRVEGSRKFENKISSKHVDFLLCDPTTMEPILAIELDDASHNRPDRQRRDNFVDRAFAAAGLPILHIPAAGTYAIADIQQQIESIVSNPAATAKTPPPIPESSPSAPACPKCNVTMVQRKAAKGKHAGKRFWACSNYPKCRQIIGID